MNLSLFDDLSLVAQVIAGSNDRAFEFLVRKYQSSVRRFFLNQTLGDEMLSDDLAQDTFIKAYNNIKGFQLLSGFKTWLMSIAYNVWVDYLRRRKPTDDIVDVSPIGVPLASDDQLSTDIKIDLYTAMKFLTDNERTCITLFYIEDFPQDKIMQITNLSENTVKSHIYRGKQKLLKYLKQYGYK